MIPLLFDNNLSPRLVSTLSDLFQGRHVATLGLAAASDEQVWAYARQHGLMVVTKDADFQELAVLRGAPPKVVWLRLGNCSTADVAALLRSHAGDIFRLGQEADLSVLEIWGG